MKKELFEDKLIKFEKENSLLGDIFKDNVTNFILTNWEGEEEELFGSRYELMRFVYDNYFRYFEEQIVSLDTMLQLIKDFKRKKNKVWSEKLHSLENPYESWLPTNQCLLNEALNIKISILKEKIENMKKYMEEV